MKSILKFLSIGALCFACVMGLAACNSSQSASSSPSPSDESALTTDSSTAAPSGYSPSEDVVATDQISLGEHVLVAYFSAMDNTESLALSVAEDLNADTFAIQPVVAYTEEDLDFDNENSRVSKEHADVTLQQVDLETTEVANWDSYDTVFLGYPLWWGEAAWPMDVFVAANNFTGKNVVPFCLSDSATLGTSAEDLQALATGGTWAAAMAFPLQPTVEEVNAWIQTFILDMNQ